MIHLFDLWGEVSLRFLSQEDVEKETYDHQDQSSYLYSIVVIPAKEKAADEQNCAKNYYDGSQILLEVVHCYIVYLFFLLGAK